jgi:hypothetical protein
MNATKTTERPIQPLQYAAEASHLSSHALLKRLRRVGRWDRVKLRRLMPCALSLAAVHPCSPVTQEELFRNRSNTYALLCTGMTAKLIRLLLTPLVIQETGGGPAPLVRWR